MALTRLQQLRAQKLVLDDKLRGADLNDNSGNFERVQRQHDNVCAELRGLEARAQRFAEIEANPTMRQRAGMPVYAEDYAHDLLTGRTLDPSQDLALRSLDIIGESFTPKALDRVEGVVRSDRYAAREIAAHSTPEYASAFWKVSTLGDAHASVVMTDGERAALAESFNARSERSQVEGTPASGGYSVPVQLDSSLIVTDQESPDPIRQLARTVECNTNVWKGVSSVGTQWSFDAEGATVSDDGLYAIAQPSVTVFMARGFIPFSVEVSQDWPAFQAEMARVLGLGYDELLASKFASGSGVGEPKGILTALAASSPTSIVTSTTDGSFGQEDVYATWAALPAKYRARASWLMNVDVMDRIRQMGTSNVYHAFTQNLTANAIDALLGKPVFDDPYFPVFSNTTGSHNRMICGDFSNYVIASRSGLAVELVPHLFDATNSRPTGSRGWFAFARVGGSTATDAAFRMQSNV
jgi:HK97 family phage major capsid protein